MGEVCKSKAKSAANVVNFRNEAKPSALKSKILELASITEQISDSIISTDINFKITYVNSAFEKIFGYSKEEVLGKSPDMLNADSNSEQIQKEIYRSVSSGQIWKGHV